MVELELTEIVELLNKAAAGELQASIQYVWQHVVVKGMTSPEVADLLRKIAIEEMKHYEKIAERIDYLGGSPTVQPDPIARSRTNVEMLKDDIKAEEDAIRLYRNIVETAIAAKDYATAELFEDLLSDEEGHHHAFLTLLE
jgi:bacterioferritin